MAHAGILPLRPRAALLLTLALALGAAVDANAQSRPPSSPPGQQQGAAIQFRVHAIIDEQQGGLVLGTITVPVHWNVSSRVQWNYGDVSRPATRLGSSSSRSSSSTGSSRCAHRWRSEPAVWA